MKKLIILGICLTFGLSACNKNSIKMDYDGATIKDSDINIREGVRIVFEPNKTTQNINPKNFKENIPVIDKRLDSIGLRGHYIFMEEDKIVVITTPVKDPDRLAKFLSKKVNLVFKEPDSNNLLTKNYSAQHNPVNQNFISYSSYSTQPSYLNWQVIFKFNDKGSKIINDISNKYILQKFLMELDNQIVGPTVINEVDMDNFFVNSELFPNLRFEKDSMILSYISAELAQKLKSKDLQIKFQEPVNDPKTKIQKRSECCLLWQESLLNKNMIENIESKQLPHNTHLLNKKFLMITFNEEGKNLFADFTQKYLNREIAIELDGKVISSSRIYEPIKDGRVSVYLPDSFDNENVIELSSQLQSGQPVSDLNILDVRTF